MRALLLFVAAAAAMHSPGPDITKLLDHSPTHLRDLKGPLFGGQKLGETPMKACEAAVTRAGLPEGWTKLSEYKTKHNGVTHIALEQQVGGLACSNCIITCNVARDGSIISFSHLAAIEKPPSLTPTITARQALAVFISRWNGTVPGGSIESKTQVSSSVFNHPQLSPEPVKTDLVVLATSPKKSELCWRVQIETEDPYYHMYEGWVDATPAEGTTAEVVQHVDLVDWDTFDDPPPRGSLPVNTRLRGSRSQHSPAKAAEVDADWLGGKYEVYTIPNIDPTLGDREVKNDIEFRASPLGWHDQGNGNVFTTTMGNNVCAQDNPTGGTTRGCINTYRPDGGVDLDFRFDFDKFADPATHPTKDAAITNLFYWHNIVHDIFYLNGFDEAAGNFQENNFGKGGLGGDAVQANAQDGAGYNNANFATPVDGQRPRCRMYLWNAHTPMKDGDFDSGIIIHEIGHGVSNRLTGGPQTSSCLPGGQSGGMGEGWSDWWAIMLLQKEEFKSSDAFPMGDYVREGGIRIYPYSYNLEVNPATYGYLDGSAYTGVHAIGSVWCGILVDVYWVMRAEFGFSKNWYNGTAGNNVLWQNVLDGLKLQPCRPTFVDARDAILLADQQNYGGIHQCTMWCAFARRGLGVSASSTGYTDRNPKEAFDSPPECDCANRLARLSL